MNRGGELAMNRKDRDRIQYAFDFASPQTPDCDRQSDGIDGMSCQSSVVVEFVDLKTKSLREDAIRRVRAQGIFRVG